MNIPHKRSALFHVVRLFPCFALLAFALAIAFLPASSRASDISWSASADPGISATNIADWTGREVANGCHQESNIAIAGIADPQSTCMYNGTSLRLALYSQTGAVAYSGDTKFYTVSGIGNSFGPTGAVLIPGTDTAHYRAPINSTQASLAIYKNFSSRLAKTSDTQYTWDRSNPSFELKDDNGDYIPVRAVGYSENGKWVVAELKSQGIALINIDTLQAKIVSKYSGVYGQGSDPVMELRVSNDGKHVAITGQNTQLRAIDATDTCGDTPTYAILVSSTMPHPCPERELYSFVSSHVDEPAPRSYFYSPRFSDDSGELTFYYGNGGADATKFITLDAAGYTPTARLDYLALGDSYASGEGDIEKKPDGTSYYTPVTDYNGGCHLSERSYPFRLRNFYNIAPSKMESVACSGALTLDIKSQSTSYVGQGDRLGSLGSEEIATRQARALDVFNPGYVEQIKFIERYKPKVITLTIGGNDVGFEGVVKACAEIYSVLPCSYAKEDQLRGQLGNSIKGAFRRIKESVEAIQIKSPNTKIYLLGYPQFIYSGTAICGLNVGMTDSDERLMMTEGVKYMNQVIKAVAHATRVTYVDIENSLVGGLMCESGEYVTGAADISFNKDLYGSTFHPNAKGHAKIADVIGQQLDGYNLLTYPYMQAKDDFVQAPAPTPYFANAMEAYGDRSAHYENITSQPATKTQPTTASGPKYTLKVGSTFNARAQSDPVDLGTFTANDDGSFNAQITFPAAMPAGFHTLVLSGESYSGEPIDIYQVVEVQGSNPHDRDEDGIDDSVDACLYIPTSGQDKDQDGIDDACDPEITDPPVPKDSYRLRVGDPSKTYAGQAEQANALYLERNIYASAKTGVIGDYDPDHDGWVVIATNQGAGSGQPPLAPYARFWSDGNDGSVIPHVSFRTKENGCVQYKPADLSQVTQSNNGTPRIFAQEAVDTNTCRSEPITADADNNGQPDNTQPLYLARSGESTKGEDFTKLYLFRSTRAAEAQLGKSDYASNDPASTPTTIPPTDTKDYRKLWTLLATSPAYAYNTFLNNFTKFKLINNYPYVLTGYTSTFYTQCTAYKPDNLATIKQSTQTTRQLQLDWITGLNITLQGGCNG
jgi:lysophospholipase L1-like esterase